MREVRTESESDSEEEDDVSENDLEILGEQSDTVDVVEYNLQ